MTLEITSASLPQTITGILQNLANLWTLASVVVAFGVLAWFVYWVMLRKLLRVRRIANLRLRRMLEERDTGGPDLPAPDQVTHNKP